MKRFMKWALLVGVAGPTLVATTCSTQLQETLSEVGTAYVQYLASALLGAMLP
ncbi:MAG TPA: hypothetical protein PKK06_04640 [Phycisphaerae bacterium]|nr:hypothetical protein [Phycisphaerae bacterium]HNU45127.1 hypothetical protein [Phycisphaerae bacterium]